ncbi:ethanolamine-phosphate phospho-lyase [Eurytemora carolleeae]|uniref:ethanolamine-phosphate phospho-lyase n=1 Tax=Eurytemora carolleeae TaxID=1294199 RepID=UPI000C7673DA|nr:ethanolamine-phosphate phospho-lyase [Eurytemora carolleeae]|eukprot:XP_023341923.1 ethanolamine-phosphate phospho-lyase-like [Eurytemora affinis]
MSALFREFEKSIDELEKKGRKLAAFILEPMFVIPGVHLPPASCIQAIFRCIQSRGGLVIVDEVQTGLGRTGDHMWGFMHYEVVPDIVTIGKPMGNGYPMGGVICSQKLANSLRGYYSTFGGNPVSCSIGLSVLEIVNNEKLTTSAKMVGKFLKTEFQKIMISHQILGDFRGLGLLFSLEIVESKTSKTPAPELATEAMYGLKFHNVLVAITGRQKNILLITPPMCFNIENARRLCKNLDDVLRTIEQNLENKSVIVARPGINVTTSQRFKRSAELEGNEESLISKRSRVSESEDRYNDMD